MIKILSIFYIFQVEEIIVQTKFIFERGILKFLWEINNLPNGLDDFLMQLGEIWTKSPYRNRRILRNKILNDALQAEKEAGLISVLLFILG